MKHWKLALTLTLALVMLVISPMQVLAASRVEYISEIRIGYGDDGKAALEDEGFTLWEDLNANEGGNGSGVWLGYTTTTDPEEAITDVALMNMKGGYSFDAYTKEIEDLNRRVSEQLASFEAAIEEFRTNYEDGNPFAEEACKIMNGFTDDESDDMGIGDIFLDESTSQETLHRIFLEGNAEAIAAIEQSLALACIELGDENVLTRLEESEYPDELDPDLNAARTALMTVFDDFHSAAISAQTATEEIESYEGGAEAFFAQENRSEEELCLFAVQYSKYLLLSETPFGNSGMSLLDFALLDEEVPNEDGEVLEDEYLEMLAQSMTEGQLGIVANVGIMTILVNAAAAENADEFEVDEDLEGTVSVYYGVDRQLFEDIDGIALTSAALREKAAAEGSSFGKDANEDWFSAEQLALLGTMAALAGSGAIWLGVVQILEASGTAAGESIAFWDTVGTMSELLATANAPVVSVAGIFAVGVGVVAIIAAIVFWYFAVSQWIEKPEIPHTDYTEIPRVIVEKPDGQRDFIAYYAARLAGAEEDETDSTKLYGDLNGLNDMDEWVALYYSRNPSQGVPITTEMLLSDSGVLEPSKVDDYTPVHMFGSDSAANLNQFNSAEGAKAVYLFFRNDSSAVSQSGSLFNGDTVIMSLVTFVVGAGLAAAVTYGLMRRKKPQTAK